MATFLIYATTPADCLAFTAVALKFGKTATDKAGLVAVKYDGEPSDIAQALEKEPGAPNYLLVEVTDRLGWKGNGALSTVGDLILGLS